MQSEYPMFQSTFTDPLPMIYHEAMVLVAAGWAEHAAVKKAIEVYDLVVDRLESDEEPKE
jgi:hypothetical protein